VSARPAPEQDVWWSGLRCVEAAPMQVLNDDFELSRSWRESYDANNEQYDPQRPLRVPTWSLHMQIANELDLLGVAIRNCSALKSGSRSSTDRR
jgi:hypothetical protein